MYNPAIAQAIRDGVMVDISVLARMAGVAHPVAISHVVFDRFQDFVPDILQMLRLMVMLQRGLLQDEFSLRVPLTNDVGDTLVLYLDVVISRGLTRMGLPNINLGLFLPETN